MFDLIYSMLKDLFSGVIRHREKQLTSEENDILRESPNTGELYLLHVDMFGDWVRSGNQDFFKKEDLSYNARYYDALERLLQRGFVRHQGGDLFRLTGHGFEAAQRLKLKRNRQTKGWRLHFRRDRKS